MNSRAQVLLVSLCGAVLVLGLVVGLRTQAVDAADSVLYVKPGGSGNCSSWPDACTLQAALDSATPGDEVWVAAGMYTPTLQSTPGVTRSATFQLKPGVGIYGGFAATETLRTERNWEKNVTVLSGDLEGDDVTDAHGVITTTARISGTNSYHVVTSSDVTETAVLDGFTITGGSADGASPHDQGGGMVNDSGGPTLAKVTFRGNLAISGGGMYNGNSSPVLSGTHFISNTADYGAGMYNLGSSLTLTDVTVISNTAVISGGGMYNDTSILTATHVTIISNTAQYGGGMANYDSNLVLSYLSFARNQAIIEMGGINWYGTGGGMYNLGSSATLISTTFSGNSAAYGGGMTNYTTTVTATNVTFGGNSATWCGGGMLNRYNSDATLTDVTFNGNTSDSVGGGMHNWQSHSATLTDVTFSNNQSDNHGGGMYNLRTNLTLTDVTFSGNSSLPHGNGGGMRNYGSSPTLTNVIFISNTAVDGGGMYNDGYEYSSNLTLSGTQFISNTAIVQGGGMYNQYGRLTLTNVIFNSNTAVDMRGGGMTTAYGDARLTDVTFSNNKTGREGGGMFSGFITATLMNVNFISNTANYGGGMWSYIFTATLTDVSVISNTAIISGGGMYNIGVSQVGTNVAVASNTADYGGGIYSASSPPSGYIGYGETFNTSLTNVSVISNTAIGGGGMYNAGVALTLSYFSLTRNQADDHGGGMYSSGGSPMLVNGVFTGNRADADGDNAGLGGGMYNLGSSPTLINTTFSGNSAIYGGGMANDTTTDATPTLSLPELKNTILWGNAATAGGPQIYDLAGSQAVGFSCMVEGGYTGCFISDTESPFMDADGVDDVPGTADDDLRLMYTSDGIDAGDNDALPQDGDDLDGDGDVIEKLPFDLAGDPRCFEDNDLDGAVDADMNPCEINTVDLGAYEAQCYGWDMQHGYDLLEEGQKYRLGFHAETTMTSTVTIADTLEGYAAEMAAGNLIQARQAFETALDCAVTVTEMDHAVRGLQEVIWEQATGAMLQGNELLVQALDVTAAGESVAEEIDLLTQAKDLYSEATSLYLEPLANKTPGFLAALQVTRTHPITTSDVMTPTYVDLERLAMASAKKSRAYLELAERYFRNGEEAQAEATLREGLNGARVELTLLYTLWPEVVDDVNYTALLRNIEDMDRMYGYLVEDKNPFGYGTDFVPFHYHPDLADKNNYLRTKAIADADYLVAENVVQDAQGRQQEIDDNYEKMQTRLADVQAQYDSQLVQLCGSADVTECEGGEINEQVERIKEAMLRIDRVLQQMENQNQLIRIEQERVAQVAGIHKATAQLISDTGEELASLAKQEVELRESQSTAGGIMGVLNGAFSGAFMGSRMGGPWGGIAGGLFGGLTQALNWNTQNDVAEDLADIAAKKEKLYAKQKAAVQYAEADIAEADSLALQRQYFLKFAELEIDYAIALSNLVQELARLNSLQTQAQYLVAERAKARAFTALLYRDPAGRVLRDSYMELAHYRYERALDSAYRAGRALEYEINQDATFTGLPLSDLEDLYPLQDITFLYAALAQIDDAYTDWLARPDIPQPQSRTDTVYLSRVLGFEDTYDPDLGRIVTREEKFNAFVREPANRVDRDDDGDPELEFHFQTSIYPGNKSTLPLTVFNDKVLSIRMRVRGDALSLDGRELLQVDVSLRQAGTSLMRTENSEVHMGGPDDVRAYNLFPLDATIQAAINDHPFPQDNEELFSRSVANADWAIRVAGFTQNLNLDNIDEIELVITHEAYSLQTGRLSSGTSGPLPTRPYRPMAHALAPLPSTRSPLDSRVGSGMLAAKTGANDLNDTYIGSVVITRPLYLTPIDLTIVLTDTQGNLSGYISPTLSYPVADQGAYPGPAVSGSWSGDSFNLQSELFTTDIAAGIPITRQVFLHTGVISDSGEILSGVYSETLAGLTPEPMEIFGEFWLIRPAHVLTAAFTAQPFAGNLPLEVSFTDLSYGTPTDWAWSFGDGVTSAEQNPIHTYAQVGSYTVTLTISNTFALNTKTEADYIIVKQPAIYLPLVLKSSL